MNAVRKALICREWKKGAPTSVICRQIESPLRPLFPIFAIMAVSSQGYASGGRQRSMLEREEISRGLAVGISIRSIAITLGRRRSKVSREIAKNGGLGRYHASDAEVAASNCAIRPKTRLLASNARLRELVAGKLAEN